MKIKFKITTFDESGKELISRDFQRDGNTFEDDWLYDLYEDSVNLVCEHCDGTGKADISYRDEDGNFVPDRADDCVCVKSLRE